MKAQLLSEKFVKNIDGKSTQLFKLKNASGMEVFITNYGARVVAINVPDRYNNFDDVVLGFGSIDEYITANELYFGAVIGRNSNRIAHGKLTIENKEITLAKNNGKHHLHGGKKGFHAVVWDAQGIDTQAIELLYLSKDGEEGYPGNLNVKVRYSLTPQNALKIEYEATTDQATVVNLTHHSFFNLGGEGESTTHQHVLQINAQQFTPVDTDLIPTGEYASVEGTPFDFRVPKSIQTHLHTFNEQLRLANGYDHNFVLDAAYNNADGLIVAANVWEPISGRTMQVLTNEPGLQFYGGNFLQSNDIGKCGKPYGFQSAFCLETQHFPDAPNQPFFPTTVLKPGVVYYSICVYQFGIQAIPKI